MRQPGESGSRGHAVAGARCAKLNSLPVECSNAILWQTLVARRCHPGRQMGRLVSPNESVPPLHRCFRSRRCLMPRAACGPVSQAWMFYGLNVCLTNLS